jgi:putative ABC transport system permease protein
METLWHDLRYGARMLLGKPGFAVTAVLALGLGIGANTAIFSVINAALLNPLPYREPDRIVRLFATFPDAGAASNIKTISYPDFLDFQSQNQVFDDVAIIDGTSLTLTGAEEPERLRCALVSAELFPLLGARAILGRTFLAEEDRPAAASVVILSHGLWQRRFGASAEIIGKEITLTRNNYTVIGVMPPDFKMPQSLVSGAPTDVWLPVTPSSHKRSRAQHRFEAYARLKPGTSIEQAQSQMDAVAASLEQQYPDTNKDKGVKLTRLGELVVRDSRTVLFVLLGAVGFVLLIACANVANLILARTMSRNKEIAIRLALGAGRGHIIQQLLTESLILALAGGAVGLLIALWGADAFVALGPEGIPRLDEVGIDLGVFGFTAGLSLLTGVVFGLVPALQASKTDLLASIKEGGVTASAGAGSRRLRHLLVTSEVALSLVLLIGAGLLIKSFWRLQHIDPGVDVDNLLTLQLSLPQSEYAKEEQTRSFYQQLVERVKTIPGVQSAGAVNILPLGGGFSCDSFKRDDQPAQPGQEPCAEYRSITPDYFRTMGVSLVEGRQFAERDNQDGAQVAIINETFARQFFPDVNPIGMRVTPDTGKAVSREIVGVVEDVKHFGLDKEAAPELYIPHAQDPWPRSMTVVLRASSDAAGLITAVRAEVWAINKDLPVLNVRTMEQLFANSVGESRFRTLLISVFAAVAMLLSALGIYGVMAYSVAERTHEIGIRLALGARPSDIFRMVVGQGMALAGAGLVIGIVGALVLTRVIAGFLFQVSATDFVTFAGVSALLILVALAACLIPAHRATKVDPMVALRYE